MYESTIVAEIYVTHHSEKYHSMKAASHIIQPSLNASVPLSWVQLKPSPIPNSGQNWLVVHKTHCLARIVICCCSSLFSQSIRHKQLWQKASCLVCLINPLLLDNLWNLFQKSLTFRFSSDVKCWALFVSVTLTRKCYSNYSAPSLLAVKLPALGAEHGSHCTSLAFSLTGRRKESEIAERGRAWGSMSILNAETR